MTAIAPFTFQTHDHRRRPYNWRVQAHSAHAHIHAAVNDHALELYSAGARHIPLTPSLCDVALTLDIEINERIAQDMELRLFFRYDQYTMRGLCLQLSWTAEGIICALGTIARRDLSILEKNILQPTGPTGCLRLLVRLQQHTLTLRMAPPDPTVPGQTCRFALPETAEIAPGAVGLERGFFPGILRITAVHVEPLEPVAHHLLAEHTVTFPTDLNGQNIPFRFVLKLFRVGSLYELNVHLSGGAFEKPEVPWFPYHGRVIDFLTRPYVRHGTTRDGILYLANTRLVMGNVKGAHFYEGLYEKPEWPLEHTFRLEEQPDILFLGYEHYMCTASQHLQGGPTEIGVDMTTGEVVYEGERVLEGECALSVSSSDCKQLVEQLPKDDPRHDRAVEFARNNHFFVQDEPLRFTAHVVHALPDVQMDELTLDWQIEDAFLEPMRERSDGTLSPCHPERSEGSPAARDGVEIPRFARNDKLETLNRLDAQLPDLPALPVGVYHLRIRLGFGNRVLKTLRKAFEVVPRDPDSLPAPLASGLPVLYSSATETMGLDTDPFDPWNGRGVDAAHYTSIACFVPPFAREAEPWKVLPVYRRKWFMWLTARTAADHRIEANRDLIAHCDYINLAADDRSYHLYLWKWPLYKGILLHVLNRFLGERREAPLAAMTADVFERRVLPVWKEWILYFCRWLRHERLPEQKRILEAINPRIRRCDYGPINAYTSNGKSAYNMLFRGLDPRDGLGRFYNGFYLYEDYPVACGYPLHSKTYTLASMKLEDPTIQYHPELYSSGWQGCPDSAVMYANPPYGNRTVDPRMVRKRLFEYAYATVWHDGEGFHHWVDNGFHTRDWNLDLYHALLRAWRFVKDVRPAKPLRSTAFIYSRELCLRHHDTYRKPAGPYPSGDLYNTAEECIAHAYDMARREGLQAGFTASLDSLDRLQPCDVDLLVLPPLLDVSDAVRTRIRELHAAGVNLLCFETVTGLEDLFGVAPLDEPVRVANIEVALNLFDAPLPPGEHADHEECMARYRATTAETVLEGRTPPGVKPDEGIPVLTVNRTPSGQAALWTIPPTVVRKDLFFECGGYGRESISPLVNRTTQLLLHQLGAPTVTTTEGKIIAFRDTEGNARIVVSEDAFPEPARPIHPLVTIRIPDLNVHSISCDRDFSMAAVDADHAAVRLQLDANECAVITVRAANPEF